MRHQRTGLWRMLLVWPRRRLGTQTLQTIGWESWCRNASAGAARDFTAPTWIPSVDASPMTTAPTKAALAHLLDFVGSRLAVRRTQVAEGQ